VDTAVLHGFVSCGATGAITGIGNVLPREVLHLMALSQAAAKGDVDARQRAQELDAAMAVLSSFDEGPDLVLYYKHLMVLGRRGLPPPLQRDGRADGQPAGLRRAAVRPVPRLVRRVEQAARRGGAARRLKPAPKAVKLSRVPHGGGGASLYTDCVHY
jgi:dihydrodipicolinate synthase/N-acetylneuraminate lyase